MAATSRRRCTRRRSPKHAPAGPPCDPARPSFWRRTRGGLVGGAASSNASETAAYFKYALLLPAVIWVVAFTFLPLLSVIRYSFSSYVMGEGVTGFVGFQNYVDVLTSGQFWQSILVTIVYVVVAVPIELVLGFLAAWLVNLGAPGSKTFRTIIGSPLFTLEVAIGYLGVTFFTDQGGLIAVPLSALGIHVPWMSTAYGGIAGAIILDVWRWTSFIFIIVLAGSQASRANSTTPRSLTRKTIGK